MEKTSWNCPQTGMLNKWFHTEMENKMEKGEKRTWPSHLKHAFCLLSIHKGTIEQSDGFRPSGIGMQSMKLNAREKTGGLSQTWGDEIGEQEFRENNFGT